MNPAQTEMFDQAILQVLDLNGSRFGLEAKAVSVLVKEQGFSPTVQETERRLDYMADEAIAFVKVVDKGDFNTANRAWKIAARGINYLRERGL